MKNSYLNLQKIINIKFNNIKLLESSLIHKSYDNTHNNEKLEFLGDRVLGLVLAKKLMEKYPNEKEGILDKKFANLVNKKTCLLIAKKLELEKFIITNVSYHGLKRSNDKILGDGLEALIGAIFLDKGLQVSEKFILYYWKDYLEKSSITKIDSKTLLQEYSLKKYKILPVYKISNQSGSHHEPVFKAEVQISYSKKFFATGKSKKEAQQSAAKKLLNELKI